MSGYFSGRDSVECVKRMRTKLIAMYLPQFHEIPENNDAWGKGFTEWVNVRKARPLFLGHHQPRIPLHENYYNLLEHGVMARQIAMAKKAGIYGFCFYHYWFGGRMVLEKPVEMLLNNKKIDFHYCFSWANEPWTKTWHGAGGNKEILIPQNYGGKEEWETHYNYFRPYFLDERYIKEENRPVLMIYRLRNIPRFNDMIRYWNECARRDGFSGIFIISMNRCRENVEKSCLVNASVDFEPNRTKAELLVEKPILNPKEEGGFLWNRLAMRCIDYRKLNEKMLGKEHAKHHFRMAFVDFDDSPRRSMRAVIMKGSSPKRFGKYLKKTMQLSMQEGNEYVFLNAWNEWGEGNYLEPDIRHRYGYLKQIKKVTEDLQEGDL